jgi:hypothetical protein
MRRSECVATSRRPSMDSDRRRSRGRAARFAPLAPLLLAFGCTAAHDEEPPRSGEAGGAAATLRLVPLGSLALEGEAECLALAPPIAWIGLGRDGIVAVDLSDPLAPSIVGRAKDVRADRLSHSEDRLFALSRPGRLALLGKPALTVLDVVDPTAPRITETSELDAACAVAASAARCAVARGSEVTLGAESRVARAIPSGEIGSAVALDWRGDVLAVLIGRDGSRVPRGTPLAALRFFHVDGAIATPRGEVGFLDGTPTSDRSDVALSRDAALVAAGSEVVAIGFGGSDDGAQPTVAAQLPLRGARRIAWQGDFAVAIGDELLLLDTARSPPLEGRRAALGFPLRDVGLDGSLLVIAAGTAGLRLYRVERETPRG